MNSFFSSEQSGLSNRGFGHSNLRRFTRTAKDTKIPKYQGELDRPECIKHQSSRVELTVALSRYHGDSAQGNQAENRWCGLSHQVNDVDHTAFIEVMSRHCAQGTVVVIETSDSTSFGDFLDAGIERRGHQQSGTHSLPVVVSRTHLHCVAIVVSVVGGGCPCLQLPFTRARATGTTSERVDFLGSPRR